uniref:Uncharacterized protein n=1 Tax=Oryza meridionalis TaxID=40149 RepID=A0A0E0D1S1_9ORYZ
SDQSLPSIRAHDSTREDFAQHPKTSLLLLLLSASSRELLPAWAAAESSPEPLPTLTSSAVAAGSYFFPIAAAGADLGPISRWILLLPHRRSRSRPRPHQPPPPPPTSSSSAATAGAFHCREILQRGKKLASCNSHEQTKLEYA